MKNKAVVSVLEMLIVVGMLMVAFGVLFPGFSHENRWEQAFISLKGRDLLLTLDRTANIHKAAFNETFLNDYLNKTAPTKLTNLIYWSGADGTIKPVIVVACDCTEQQKNKLISWIGRIKFNNRDVDFDIVSSGLNPIYQGSDVLLIWGDKDLTPYKSNLENYLKNGNGIVEIMDLSGNLDSVQSEIFGLSRCSDLSLPSCSAGVDNEISLIKPDDAKRIVYQGYKYFHHIPMTGWATSTVPLVPGPGVEPCGNININSGVFRFRENDYSFWICDGKSVYFDTGGNPQADIKVKSGETFVIDGQTLLLSYIDGNTKIGVALKEGYKFKNFLNGNTKLYPDDKDVFRILASKGNYANSQNPIPAAVLSSKKGRVAWIADFTKDLNKVGDDQKLLLANLLALSSDKKFAGGLSNLKLGHLTQYVNVVNQDMYEVYRFDLGLGFPF